MAVDTYALTIPVPVGWAEELKSIAATQQRPRVAIVRELLANYLKDSLPAEQLQYSPAAPGRPAGSTLPFRGGEQLRQLTIHLYGLGYSVCSVAAITAMAHNTCWAALDRAGVALRGTKARPPLPAGDIVNLLRNPATPDDVLRMVLDVDADNIELLRSRHAAKVNTVSESA